MKYRVAALWNQFRTQVMNPAAPADQVREMRRAFYAGVESALNRLADEMSPGDGLDDPNDHRAIMDVQNELRQFASDVAAGKA